MALKCKACGGEYGEKALLCPSCGILLGHGAQGQSAPLLDGRYEIRGLIKSGGMGSVYKAFDNRLRRMCAVKEMQVNFSASSDEQYARRRFEEEAMILAKLGHKNLPVMHDYFSSSGKYYLVMDLVEGEDLLTVLNREGSPGMAEQKILEWARQILDVLAYLHSQNPPIVYRDLKPENIMLSTEGRIILIDFGIAREVSSQAAGAQTAIGTFGYAPLEQHRGNATAQSDLYALGATMHHLLSGRKPAALSFEPLRNIIPSISPETEAIVIKSLQEDPGKRFQSAREMLAHLPAASGLPEILASGAPFALASAPLKQSCPPRHHVFDLKWGSLGGGNGQFNSPRAIAHYGDESIFVSDPANNRIQKFDPAGSFKKGWRIEGYHEGELEMLHGIAVASPGRVIVADSLRDCILIFDLEGDLISSVGSFGSSEGKFHKPCDVAIDGEGTLSIADSRNFRIQRIDASGAFLLQWGSYGTGDGQFLHIKSIAIDKSGNVYVTDGKQNRVQKFDSSGRFLRKWGTKGTQEGQLHEPGGIFVDEGNFVYVADTGNHRVQIFDSDGNFVTMFGSYGSADGKFKSPSGITADGAGHIFVVDTGNNRIQKFKPC